MIVWFGIFGALTSRNGRQSLVRALASERAFLRRVWSAFGLLGVLVCAAPLRAEVPQSVQAQVEEWCGADRELQGVRVNCGQSRYTGDAHGASRVHFDTEAMRSGTLRGRVYDSEGAALGWLMLEVEVLAQVWVLTRSSQAGEPAHGAVEAAWVDTRLLARDVLHVRQGEPEGVLRQAARQGEVLRSSSVELPLVVRRQQMVTLEVRRGGVLATGRGIALQDARVGDMVRIQSAFGEQVLSGIVRANGNVEVP